MRREKGGGVWREIGVQCRAATSEASTQHPNPNPDGEAEASFRSNNAGESHAQRNGLAAYTWRAERLSSIYQATHAGYVSDMSAQTDAPAYDAYDAGANSSRAASSGSATPMAASLSRAQQSAVLRLAASALGPESRAALPEAILSLGPLSGGGAVVPIRPPRASSAASRRASSGAS